MIDITFDEIGEHIEQGDIKEWLAELRVLNATKGMLADDRKTEPQTADCPFDDKIPCEWVNCPNSTDCPYKPKTEPTISKMEQVDKDINVRSKDEPQTDCAWREPK